MDARSTGLKSRDTVARAPDRLPWPKALRVILALSLAGWLVLGLGIRMVAAAGDCAVALLLAIDVSGSVTTEHYIMQRDATAEALRSPAVRRSAQSGLRTAVMMWGSGQHAVVGFRDDPVQTAAHLVRVPRPESGSTDMAAAIRAATAALLAEPCERRVLDISGDGRHNTGPMRELEAAVTAAFEADIEINALPIVTPQEPELGAWYRTHVTSPAGGFVIEAEPEAFARAIRAKLAMEIAAR